MENSVHSKTMHNEMFADDADHSKNDDVVVLSTGRLEELKRKEEELMELLALLREEKQKEVHSSPLTIGIVGFGNFGQFLGRTFVKHAKVIGTSRRDYTPQAEAIGASYIPLSDFPSFLKQVDVVLFAVAINVFESTVKNLVDDINQDTERRTKENIQGILFVDVCSVKEHPRQVMLDLFPEECDILCTHPMFGPVSGANGWTGLRFIYEKTRVNKQILTDPNARSCDVKMDARARMVKSIRMSSIMGLLKLDDDEADHTERGIDRMERFLSIWEEEGCTMKAMTCKEHDMYAAKSQFITHLLGRVLGQQGLMPTPVDTKGFESVLGIVKNVTSDSYDLFEGLFKFNRYAPEVLADLKEAMDKVECKLTGHRD